MSSQKMTGLASAFEPSKTPDKSGVTTSATHFEKPLQGAQQSSKVSDLASRFAGTDTPTPSPSPGLPIPMTSPKTRGSNTTSPSWKTPTKTPSPKTQPEVSRKVSDLSKAFSSLEKPLSTSAFSAAQSTFQKSDSGESKVFAFAKKLDSDDGAKKNVVSGVARSFESRDMGAGVKASPRFEKEVKKEFTKEGKVEKMVDGFASVASRFEAGTAGKKEDGEEDGGAGAKERFRGAAKLFGGS